ncbi:uncharacterized protein TNCV_1031521 [Trichonephila clavipes]|nr:uncharacterized protein TNCV_1031521 [Trichonephila clavipes]
MENVAEFLENIDNNLTYYEIPPQLACAYLKGHLTGQALDWFEVLGYRVVEDRLRALKASFDRTVPREMTEEKLLDHVISRLEPQILDYVEVRHPQTTSNLLQIIDKNRQENWREMRGNNRHSDNSKLQREFNRFVGQGVADNRIFDGRRRGDSSDHRFHNQGGRQGGSRNGAFRGRNDQNRYLNF